MGRAYGGAGNGSLNSMPNATIGGVEQEQAVTPAAKEINEEIRDRNAAVWRAVREMGAQK